MREKNSAIIVRKYRSTEHYRNILYIPLIPVQQIHHKMDVRSQFFFNETFLLGAAN